MLELGQIKLKYLLKVLPQDLYKDLQGGEHGHLFHSVYLGVMSNRIISDALKVQLKCWKD